MVYLAMFRREKCETIDFKSQFYIWFLRILVLLQVHFEILTIYMTNIWQSTGLIALKKVFFATLSRWVYLLSSLDTLKYIISYVKDL